MLQEAFAHSIIYGEETSRWKRYNGCHLYLHLQKNFYKFFCKYIIFVKYIIYKK